MLSRSSPSGAQSATLTEIEYPLLVKRVFKPSPSPPPRRFAAKPPTATAAVRVGYADHAGVAGRRGYAPATQARCDGEGRDFTPNAVSKRVRAKLMPLPSYLAVFRSAVKVKALRARKRDLDRDRIPAFSKAGIQAIPLPATAASPLSPRRPPPPCESAMPTTQASPAVGATRPLRRRAATRRGGTSHQTQSQEGKGKTDALTLLSQAYFRSAVKVKPFGRASATLTEIEYPLLVKRVFKPSPSPPPRLRR